MSICMLKFAGLYSDDLNGQGSNFSLYSIPLLCHIETIEKFSQRLH